MADPIEIIVREKREGEALVEEAQRLRALQDAAGGTGSKVDELRGRFAALRASLAEGDEGLESTAVQSDDLSRALGSVSPQLGTVSGELMGIAGSGGAAALSLGQVGLIAAGMAVSLATYVKPAQAINQEFDKLEQHAAELAPRLDVLTVSQNLAAASGVNLAEVMARTSESLHYSMDEVAQAVIVNRSLLADETGRMAEELPRLAEIARAAALATGQDVNYVFDTLTRGIVKASPLLIDNAEIYIKVGMAVDEYAESVGKSVEELTMAERQQAILNAVLEQGTDFVERAGTSADMASDAFNRKARAVQHLEDEWGRLIVPIGAMRAHVESGFLETAALGLEKINDVLGDAGDSAVGLTHQWIEFVNAVEDAKDIELPFWLHWFLTGERPEGEAGGAGGGGAGFGGAELESDMPSIEAGMLEAQKQRAIQAYEARMAVRRAEFEQQEKAEEEELERRQELRAELEDLWLEHADAFEEQRGQELEIERGYADDLVEIDVDLARKLEDLATSQGEKLVDIHREYAQDVLDEERSLADDLADVRLAAADRQYDLGLDLQDELADLEYQAQQERLEINERFHERLQDLEDDHADEREEAVRLRDARAIERIDKETQKKHAQLERDYRLELRQQQRSEYDEEHSARVHYDRSLRDLHVNLDRQLRDRQTAHQRALRDLQIAHGREIYELNLHGARQLQAIQTWEARQSEDAARHRSNELRDLRFHLQDQRTILAQHIMQVNAMLGSGGMSGAAGSGGSQYVESVARQTVIEAIRQFGGTY